MVEVSGGREGLAQSPVRSLSPSSVVKVREIK